MKKSGALLKFLIFLTLVLGIDASAASVTTYDLWRPERADSYTVGNFNQGYYRVEFNIPVGTIWRAAAEIGEQGILYVNGQLVDFKPAFARRQSFAEAYMTETVDLMPYLKPGQTNCIAIFYKGQPKRSGDIYGSPWPTTFFQSKVVMSTGQVVLLDMDPSNPLGWKSTANEQSGWNQLGFDASGWNNIGEIYLERKALSYVEIWPVYDGRLAFENPHPVETLLYYKDNASILVNVLTPEGLSGTVHWTLERVNDGGTYTFLASGTQSSYTNRLSDKSKVYSLNLGIRPRGVYTLKVYLESGGTTIESKVPEPLVVTGRIPMTEVDANNIEDGLNLVLEKEIDFTTASGWIETRRDGRNNLPDIAGTQQIYTPTIVTRNGLTYRETQPDNGAMFSYQYTFQHPGDWYLLVLEYPDDAMRKTGVSITLTENWLGTSEDYATQSGPAVLTGLKYPLSGQMKEMKWIHRPDPPGKHTIDIVSVMALRPAAARKIKIYHIIGNLPALKASSNQERSIGISTERARQIGINFGINDPGISGWAVENRPYEILGYDMLQIKTQRLLWELDTVEHYVQYMRFMGQNFHVFGSYQYYWENAVYYTPPDMVNNTASVSADIGEVMLRVFESNDIGAMNTVEYSTEYTLITEPDATINVGGMGKYKAVDKNGAAIPGEENMMRITSPDIQQSMLFRTNEMAYKYSVSPAYKGMYFLIVSGAFGPVFASNVDRFSPNPDPLNFDYSDDAISEFEKDTGISVPDEPYDSGRFSRRYNFLTSSSMRDTWINWRVNYVHKIALMLRDKIVKCRADLKMVQGYYMIFSQIQDWLKSGKTYHQVMREYSNDPRSFASDANMWVAHYLYPDERNYYEYFEYWPEMWGIYPTAWEHHVNPDVIAEYNQNSNKRAVGMVELWAELAYTYVKDAGISWPLIFNEGRFQGKYAGDNSQEAFVQAMIGSDPQLFVHGLYDIGIGVEYGQELRDFNRVYTALPQEKFQPVLSTGFTTNLAIRGFQDGSTYWFYVINPGYWPAKATLSLRNINSVSEVGSTGSATLSGGNLYFDLKPFGIKAFKATTSNGGINSYGIEPLSDTNLNHMRTLISLVKDAYPKVASSMGFSSADEAFIISSANQAEQDLANGNYVSAWHTLTNWKYWQLVHDTVFRDLKVLSSFSSKQSGANAISFDASGSASYTDPLTSYEWVFGDGATGTGKTVSHTYSGSGTYIVRLTVRDKNGKSDTLVKNVAVGGANPADLNSDGIVDIYDVVFVASRIGGSDSRADVADPKGVIDMVDLVFVTSRFGQSGGSGGSGGGTLPSGQVAYWALDGNTQDSQGSYHGTYTGGTPTYVSGKVGQAISFDGSSEYISIADNSNLEPSQITITAWVKIAGAGGPIVAKGGNAGYRLSISSDTYGVLVLLNDRGTNSLSSYDNARVNEWVHVAAVGSSSGLRLYTNGELVASNSVAYGAPNVANNLQIGAETIFSSYFVGQIDDVRIFNRALSADEVVNVMYYGLPAS